MRVTGSDKAKDSLSLSEACQDVAQRLGDVQSIQIVSRNRVQVFTQSDRNPRALARDVKTALLTTKGVNVDLSSIEVVQLGAGSASSLEGARVRLKLLEVARREVAISARVQLSLGDGQATGESHGAGGQAEERRVVALAALEAIGGFLGDGVRLELLSIKEVVILDASAVLALVEWSTRIDSGILLGSSLAKGSQSEAVVRAVLDALNRFVGWFPQR